MKSKKNVNWTYQYQDTKNSGLFEGTSHVEQKDYVYMCWLGLSP